MNKGTLKPYDLFLSYVVEDRETIEAIYVKLCDAGLKVWYANRDLKPGEDVHLQISRAMNNSRHGLALISHQYNSHWVQGELFNLINMKERFIPVLHKIRVEEVSVINPAITNCFCLSTDKGTDKVVSEILDRIRKMPGIYYQMAKLKVYALSHVRQMMVFLLSSLLLLSILFFYRLSTPTDDIIETAIIKRGTAAQNNCRNELELQIISNKGHLIDQFLLSRQIQAFEAGRGNHYKDSFIFHNAKGAITGLPDSRLLEFIDNLFKPGLLMKDWRFYQMGPSTGGLSGNNLHFSCYNMADIHFEVKNRRMEEGYYEVRYENREIYRLIDVNIIADTIQKRDFRVFHVWSVPEKETLILEKKGKAWEEKTGV